VLGNVIVDSLQIKLCALCEQDFEVHIERLPFMVRQAVRVLLGRMPLTVTAYPLRVHHERKVFSWP
jgi:hypothetical protein